MYVIMFMSEMVSTLMATNNLYIVKSRDKDILPMTIEGITRH